MTFNFVIAAWFLIFPFGLMSFAFFIKQFTGGIGTVEIGILLFSLFVVAACLGIIC